MPYKEKEIEKKYFSIGEVAEIINVAPSLIRFWESEFDVIKPKKNKKGNRIFTKKDIESIKMIYHLVKEKGYTLQGAKDALKNNNQQIVSKLEVIGKLKDIREFLTELKRKLD
ncbi:MerR family transcriptional regulator [Mangrovivirga sp. M17]|uniref:MerR family transcriptional regulator n=1 Tax=Mangrovivirga halotolerans TaxID=2993936 RepID=A0ABT3RKG4_9BACT|nr:MerR family transcriptional regulator [Mangrovivirga halotolerans]